MLRKIPFWSILTVISVTSSVRAQHGGPAKVVVAPVVRQEVAPTVELVGTLHPRLRSVVAADVDGLVVEMPYDYGAVVKRGEPVCVLRDVTRRLAVDEAKAAVEALEGELAARKADVQKTTFELDRITRLAKLDRSTDKERVDANANHAAAEARVRQSRAMLDEARARLAVAEDNLDRTRILAPFDGAIVAKRTEVGQWVTVGDPAVEMVDLFTVRARVMVPEAAIGYCTPGEAAMVTVDALGQDFKGAISRVIPEADPQANTFPTDIDIANPKGVLKAGMFVRAMVPAGPKQTRLLVPKDAVLRQGPMPTLYIARRDPEKGDTADVAPVKIVAEVMDKFAVESQALHEGDLVIVRGNEGMRGPGPIMVMSGAEPNGSSAPGKAQTAPVQSTTQPASVDKPEGERSAMNEHTHRDDDNGRQ